MNFSPYNERASSSSAALLKRTSSRKSVNQRPRTPATSQSMKTLVHHQSKAKEFETFKQLPRFSHKNMACINPVARTKPLNNADSAPDFTILPESIRLRHKEVVSKDLPDHLMRAPIQPRKAKPKPVTMQVMGRDGKKLTMRERRMLLERTQQLELE